MGICSQVHHGIQGRLEASTFAIFNEKCKKVFPVSATQMFWPQAVFLIPTMVSPLQEK